MANTTSDTSPESPVAYSAPFPGFISFNTTLVGNNSTINGANGATPLFFASPANETATGGVANPTTQTVTVENLLGHLFGCNDIKTLRRVVTHSLI